MTYEDTAPTAIASTLALLDRNGEALPKAIRTKIDTALERARRVQAWDSRGPGIGAAAAAAIADNRDPAADAGVQAALARLWLADHPRLIAMAGGNQLIAAVGQHVPAIITALSNMYDRLVAQPITEAAATLEQQNVDPDTLHDMVLQMGAGNDWHTISTATDMHVRILAEYTLLRGTTGLPVPADVFLWADPGELGLIAMHNLHRSQPTPWRAVVAGCTLGLTTVAGAAERQARAAAVDAGEILELQVRAKKPSLI